MIEEATATRDNGSREPWGFVDFEGYIKDGKFCVFRLEGGVEVAEFFFANAFAFFCTRLIFVEPDFYLIRYSTHAGMRFFL